MRVIASFEEDREGRPVGTVDLTAGTGPGHAFEGWLELLRALELIAYNEGQLDATADEVAS